MPKDIGQFTFSNDEETVINHKGENFYKACDVLVTGTPDNGASYCVKRVNHPGNECEDWDGQKIVVE